MDHPPQHPPVSPHPPVMARHPVSSLSGHVRHPVRQATHLRYSRMIGHLRIAVPMLAVGLLGLVVAWPKLMERTDHSFQVGYSSLSPAQVANLALVNPRYYGLDRRNQPFSVTADLASEERPDAPVVVLDKPKADFVTSGGAGIYIEADRGFYRQQEQVLDLEGNVNLYHDQGYEMHTRRARLNLQTGVAEGHDPVQGMGPKGRLQGDGFRLSDNGKHLVMLGKSGLGLKGSKGK